MRKKKITEAYPKFFQDANKIAQGFNHGTKPLMTYEAFIINHFHTCQFCEHATYLPDDLWGRYYMCTIGGFFAHAKNFCNEYKDGVFTMSFIEACVKGKANPSQINEWVEKWNEEKLEISLLKYLGLSESEYHRVMAEPEFLSEVIKAKKVNSVV